MSTNPRRGARAQRRIVLAAARRDGCDCAPDITRDPGLGPTGWRVRHEAGCRAGRVDAVLNALGIYPVGLAVGPSPCGRTR